MEEKKEVSTARRMKFNQKKSMLHGSLSMQTSIMGSIKLSESEYIWTNKMDKVDIIRAGLPYESIEVISAKASMPVIRVLHLLDIPQTTYNKKKRDKDLLDGRDSEVILFLAELLDYGLEVFNHETEKFHRWLKKPNISMGNVTPESLFDTLTGIQEVRNSLNRLEYGNFA